MDVLIEAEKDAVAEIARTSDHPLLMMNLNRYEPGQFPDGDRYLEWRQVNAEMIENVGGRLLWSLPVKGQFLVNGSREALDEILAYWYPSHRRFLEMANFDAAKRNFELRETLIEYAAVHRCDGTNPPILP